MNYKGARIRHLESQVARLTAELAEVKRLVSPAVPLAPHEIYKGIGGIASQVRRSDGATINGVNGLIGSPT